MRVSLMAPLLLLGCAGNLIGDPIDASAGDSRNAAIDAAGSAHPSCPTGFVQIGDGQCAPPLLACTGAGEPPDPTCVPGELRSAALTPWVCPAGWRADSELGCVPTLRTDCPEGTGPLPDGTCTETGMESCPDAQYPRVPEGADPKLVIYLDDDAVDGGDGTPAHPLRELGPVLENARAGTTVLLASGRYPVQAEVRRDVRVIGVCTPRVTLVPRTNATAPDLILVMNEDGRITLENLSFDSDRRRPVAGIQGASINIRRVNARVRRNALVTVIDSTADVSDIKWEASEPLWGEQWAVVQSRGGRARLRRISASGSASRIAMFRQGTAGAIEDVAALGTEGGVDVGSGSTLIASRISISGGIVHAIRHEGGAGDYRDISVDNSATRFAHGADVILARFSGRRAGIEVYDPDTRIRAADVAMTDVRGQPSRLGSCLVAERAARVEMQRGRFIRCNDTAIYAVTGASMTLEDLYVRDARPNPAGFVGIGFTQALGGSSTIRRAIFDHAGMAAIVALHLSPRLARSLPWEMFAPPAAAQALREPSRVTLEDVVIQNGETIPEMPCAGLFGGAYSEVRGTRVSVLRQSGVGILSGDSGFERQALAEAIASAGPQVAALLPPFVDGASSMHLDSLFVGPVRRARIIWDNTTRRSQPDFVTSYGAIVSRACDLSLVDAHFEGGSATETALVSQGTLTLRGGVVRGTTRCAITRNGPAGAVVSLDDVILQGNAQNEVCNDETIPLIRLPMSPN